MAAFAIRGGEAASPVTVKFQEALQPQERPPSFSSSFRSQMYLRSFFSSTSFPSSSFPANFSSVSPRPPFFPPHVHLIFAAVSAKKAWLLGLLEKREKKLQHFLVLHSAKSLHEIFVLLHGSTKISCEGGS